jgi:hypothetical protein
MTPAEREQLIESVVSAHREPDPRGGVRPSPAFYDLDDAARAEAFELAAMQRAIESALDAQGQNATIKAVLATIADGRGAP